MPGTMTLLSIDPGNRESAFVVLENGLPVRHGKLPNDEVLQIVAAHRSLVVIEGIQSFGRPVGQEVFETCRWIGRFEQACRDHWGEFCGLIYRMEVKMHFCHTSRAKDANIRQALIDRFGGPQETKKGGVLYGIKADEWSALAIGLTYLDKQRGEASA